MNIKFLVSKVKELSVSVSDEIGEDHFSFGYCDLYSEEDPRKFLVEFDINVKSEHGYSVDVTYVAEFGTDEDIDDEFKHSHFPVVNAPAIAYPFLRSLIGTVTLNSGLEPMILPTVNFQAIAKKRQEAQ